MHFTNEFASSAIQLIIAAYAVNASPLKYTPRAANSTGHFTVHQVANPTFSDTQHAFTGPMAHAKALTKFGAALSSDLSNAISAVELLARASGSATATPLSSDSEYLVPVSIGTPAQTLNLDFDTGSSDLWVFSSETPSTEVNGQTTFKLGNSSTSKKLAGETWSITYGDGSSSSGDVYTDKVTVGGVTVTTQAVESAETVSSSFSSNAASSGLLGLAMSSINTASPTKQNTWFDNAKASLASPLFTANLKKGQAGSYTFGTIDSTQYTGSIGYAPVNTASGFWEFTGSGYQVGNGAFVSESITAVADTGTTLMLMPSAIVSAYYANVTGATYSSTYGAYVFPCASKLPDFTFGVGSYRGVIPGTYLNYAQYSSTMCYGGLQQNTGLGFSLLGDIFLKAQFVVFDSGNTRIGFANKST